MIFFVELLFDLLESFFEYSLPQPVNPVYHASNSLPVGAVGVGNSPIAVPLSCVIDVGLTVPPFGFNVTVYVFDSTVTFIVLVLPLDVPIIVIVVVPTPVPVTLPVSSTVAIFVSFDEKVYSSSTLDTVIVSLPPFIIDILDGEIVAPEISFIYLA